MGGLYNRPYRDLNGRLFTSGTSGTSATGTSAGWFGGNTVGIAGRLISGSCGSRGISHHSASQRSVSVSSDADWCVCRWHRPLYERCTIVVRLFSRWRLHSDNLPCSFSSVSGLLLRYWHEFWHFCRIPSSVYLASLRSAVEYPLDSRGQVVARPVSKVEYISNVYSSTAVQVTFRSPK